MKKIQLFDVLVVYSHVIATSPSSFNISDIQPFSFESGNENYNTVYGYFLAECKRNGIRAAFTTSSEIIDTGICKSYWVFEEEKNSWKKINKKCFAPIIFDKFSPISRKAIRAREVLFATDASIPFSDPYLLELFNDKLMTHEKLQKYSIPTVALEGSSTVAITKSLLSLQQLKKNHDHTIDFSSQIIVKDRNGAGGNHIYKVHGSDTVKIKSILRDNLALKFVIQPFILFDKGYSHKEQHGLTDIRLIFFNQKVVQAYIRIAKKDDFRCNEHKGGLLEYIALKDIPKDIIDKSKQILKSLQTKSSLYALDFIVSNNGNTFFMEGNTGPGLDWNESKKINERKAKQLIHLIVEEFIQRTEIYALQAVSKISLPEKMYLPVSQVLKIPSI